MLKEYSRSSLSNITITLSEIQSPNLLTYEENGDHAEDERHSTKTKLKTMQMLKRAGNDFKAAIWTMLKGVKEHDEIMMERQP